MRIDFWLSPGIIEKDQFKGWQEREASDIAWENSQIWRKQAGLGEQSDMEEAGRAGRTVGGGGSTQGLENSRRRREQAGPGEQSEEEGAHCM